MTANIAPVTVVTPCYRCSDTIGRAVASVAQQTVHPAEVILVDDASGDDVVETLIALRRRFGEDWIKVICLEHNGGPSVARNAGWDAATQPYIAFLDADESWHPLKIAIQYDWMSRHPEIAMSAHGMLRLTDGQTLPDPVHEATAQPVSPLRMLLSSPFCTSSVMLRRDLPFRFEPEKRHSEDRLLWLQISLSEWPIYRLRLPLVAKYKQYLQGSGLSDDVWAMRRGRIDAYRRLHASGLLGRWAFRVLRCYSEVRFGRQLLLRGIYRLTIADLRRSYR